MPPALPAAPNYHGLPSSTEPRPHRADSCLDSNGDWVVPIGPRSSDKEGCLMYGQVISSVPKRTAAGLVRLRPGAAYDDVSEILRPIWTLANYLPPDAHYWESADRRNRLQMRLDKEGRIGSVGFEGELFLPRPIEGLSLGMSIAQSLKVHP